MIKIDFNNDWLFTVLNENDPFQNITLPHDAMIFESRSLDNDGGTNVSWFKGNDYKYKKTFFLEEEKQNDDLYLEFEGIYHNAEVSINGQHVVTHNYGYTGFFIHINDYVKFNADNEIEVIVKNSDQPNSRWYSGSGIYRPVYLYVFKKEHVILNSIKIRTIDLEKRIVNLSFKATSSGEANVRIFGHDFDQNFTLISEKDGGFAADFEIFNGKIWNVDTPYLYNIEINFNGDVVTEKFGIRTVKFSKENGIEINGQHVILRGACIHSDNGILGARSYKEAEYRKVKLLKNAGYNAIRSAHNPCAKSLLDACDELGMMVMDEYCDMWYIHKTKNDYATYVLDNYEQDLKDMIEKDYNHPSVIMYSLGNEVAETGQAKGIELFTKMRDVCHKLDEEKPVTTGVNIFFNYLYSLGFGVYSDKKAKDNPQKKVGSEFFNDLAGIFGDKFMKTMAKLPGCDRKTKGCFKEMDVAGYNYGILRYKHDLKKYPDRIILGSETFCSDAYDFYEIARKNPRIAGDFVWSGMDYLGEVGIGSWEYQEYVKSFKHGVGWISAGSGRIDLIGTELGEALYTKVAFELEDKPLISVVPVPYTNRKHSPSAWKFSNAIPSWSWGNNEGMKARVEVYSRAPIVELYINGKRVGKKKFKKNPRFVFNTKYYPGEIIAVSLDNENHEIGRSVLHTAGDETIIKLEVEKPLTDERLRFVKLKYTDSNGEKKPLCRGIMKVNLDGGKLLALGNGCPFNEIGYNESFTDTYYGEALVVIRLTKNKCILTVNDGILQSEINID